MEYKGKIFFPASQNQDFLLPKDTLPVWPEKKEFNFKIVSCISRYDPPWSLFASDPIEDRKANTRCKERERERERYQSVLIVSITWYRYLLRGSNNKTFVNEPVAIVSCRWRIEVEEEGTAGGFSARIKLIKPDYLDGC